MVLLLSRPRVRDLDGSENGHSDPHPIGSKIFHNTENRFYHPDLTDEETQAKTGWLSCARSGGPAWEDLGFLTLPVAAALTAREGPAGAEGRDAPIPAGSTCFQKPRWPRKLPGATDRTAAVSGLGTAGPPSLTSRRRAQDGARGVALGAARGQCPPLIICSFLARGE